MSWFIPAAAASTAVEFGLAGGLTGIALAAACVPAVLALRAALRRRSALRRAAHGASSAGDRRMTRSAGGARRRTVAFLHRVG